MEKCFVLFGKISFYKWRKDRQDLYQKAGSDFSGWYNGVNFFLCII